MNLPEVLPVDESTSPESNGTEPDVIARSRAILHEIRRLVDERAAGELKADGARVSNDGKADSEYEKAKASLNERSDRQDREARATDAQRRHAIAEAAVTAEAQAKSEFSTSSRKIATEFDALRENARGEYSRGRSAAESACASAMKKAAKEHADETRLIDDAATAADVIRDRRATVVATYPKSGMSVTLPVAQSENYSKFEDPLTELLLRRDRMEEPLKLLEGLVIPKLTKGGGQVAVFLLPLLLLVVPAVLLELGPIGIGAAAFAGIALGAALRIWLGKVATSQLRRFCQPVSQSLANADALALHCRGLADARLKKANDHEATVRDAELKRVKENHARTIATGESLRDEHIRKISEQFANKSNDIQANQRKELRAAIEAHDARMAELPVIAAASLKKLEEQYLAVKDQIRVRHETAWKAVYERWKEGMVRSSNQLEEVRTEVSRYNPATWTDTSAWADRTSPKEIPPILRFGAAHLDLSRVPDGISRDSRMMEGVPTAFSFPTVRPFPIHANLLIEAPAEGRSAALTALQTSMFRLLTSLPPGKVRFTIVDPIGIGRGFGAFMHLADFDGDLVANQVWTDPRDIEERLSELSTHMETVTQKYLRNEYATIEEYNKVAGEVAEPYRVLVVADFPSRFDEKTAARLAAIAAGGIPCGVLTLVAADSSKLMPLDFSMDELRPHFTHLAWDGATLGWDDPDLGKPPLKLELDPPLPAEFATSEIQKIGAAALLAKRVEVPFDFIAPPENAWWTRDSRAGVEVPLGKAGATKRQLLALGRGTSQHVLIAGRTGSGKSTLMHALIVNLALNYSPDEIELYLIDFKKGVEFKVYASYELPHASVVAIESEREFGISVLQRIDTELRLRADRFRDAGVQDINGYRNLAGSPPLPRIFLIVDEFQEFFVEEDKLAQDAALLLDRIVRQGRAFGVHVHLGSQSLTGAFTLARSTLGQMAVRIALQCSEGDSHLILSEQNSAARLLSRPGEAIYNDANGAPEGNHFFQVVWLSDEKREAYLAQIQTLNRERKPILSRTPIVFEGDSSADLARNPLLNTLLDAPGWPDAPRITPAWLGEAIAIKDPTSATFRRQGGNHLLIIGQQEEGAIGVIASALFSLAAQFCPASSDTIRSGARFFVLDGTPEGHPHVGLLANVAQVLPHGVTVGGWREVSKILAEMAAELARRKQDEGGDGPEMFLFIHDLPNFRELRRREDDFSFSRKEPKESPADHLDAILKEGSRLGLHVITWCDTVNNLNRHFSNQVLREFEMRVLFQMSPSDSGHLLDSPVASKLGQNRALFVSEDQNRMEKFRPYAIPTEALLQRFSESLGSSARVPHSD